jgi:hypothetical protein
MFFAILTAVVLGVYGSPADYSGQGSWASIPAIRTDYKFRLINENSVAAALAGSAIYWPSLYQIDVRINPCVNITLTGGRGDLCCAHTGEANCQDSMEDIHAGPDLQIAYIQNAHISTCVGTEFSDDPNCGTFIEIHRAVSGALANLTSTEAEVLASVQLENAGGAFMTTYIPTTGVCAGGYELWWVVRTRSGPYVQFRKPFNVISPSC